MDSSELTMDTEIGEVPQWTSLGHMSIVVALEDAINRQLSTEEIFSIGKISDIQKLLN
jgi:acyl carrier protein